MLARASRLLLILCLATSLGCEAMRTVVGIFSWESQNKAIDRSTRGSPNEQIQFEGSQAQRQLEHRFD